MMPDMSSIVVANPLSLLSLVAVSHYCSLSLAASVLPSYRPPPPPPFFVPLLPPFLVGGRHHCHLLSAGHSNRCCDNHPLSPPLPTNGAIDKGQMAGGVR